MRRLIAALIFLLPGLLWAQSTTSITGTIYQADGTTPYDSCRVKLLGVFARGVLTSTEIRAYYTDSTGRITITVPRTDSTIVVLQAAVAGMNKIGGQAMLVPNADTAQLSSLVSITLPTAMSVLLPPLDTIRRIVSDSADVVRDDYMRMLHYPGPCTVNVFAGDTLSKVLSGHRYNECAYSDNVMYIHIYGGYLDSFNVIDTLSDNPMGVVLVYIHYYGATSPGYSGTCDLRYIPDACIDVQQMTPIYGNYQTLNGGAVYGTTVLTGNTWKTFPTTSDMSQIRVDVTNSVAAVVLDYKDSRICGDSSHYAWHGNTYTGSSLMSCDIRAVHSENSFWTNSKWTDTRISTSHFDNTHWVGSWINGWYLDNVDFQGTAGTGVPYGDVTNFDSTITSRVQATGCNFYGTKWISAKRYHNTGWWYSTACSYMGADFTNADLTRNIFFSCDMTGAIWTGAICDYINLTGCSGLPDKATFKAAVSSYAGATWVDGLPL